MNTYKIEITETLQKQIEIEAQNKWYAIDIARQKYKDCDVMLDWNDIVSQDFKVVE